MIVVTGAAGFIGSCFLWKLNRENIKNIIAVDKYKDIQKNKNLENKEFADYMDKDVFLSKLESNKIPVKTIFHIGACSSTTESDLEFLLQNNYEYSKSLAKWALKNDALFYYASSAATYGDGSSGYSDDDETSKKLVPLNKYAYSKQLFDLWAIEKKLTDKITGFKYFNVFGPNEYHKGEMRSVVLKSFEQIKKDKKVRLFKSYKPEYKDGEQKRDFIYIKDVIDIMYKFYVNPQIKGIYNIGTGKAETWNDLTAGIFKYLGIESCIEYIEMPEYLRDKYQYFTEADPGKLRSTGIEFDFMKLEDAVMDYCGYLVNNGYL